MAVFNTREQLIIFDTRGCPIREGDEVIYAVEHSYTTRHDVPGKRIIEITEPRLKISKVASIYVVPGTGFCEAGDNVVITLEDGYEESGDTENGGWKMLRLPDKEPKRRNLA